ncbi:hypothetical protein [Nonomuraea maheshkhaliensis]|uniref:hypothetical protein n=1 Tax=Nonomuraea maheshkhaliensis TaxID=419590 RepID=UPI0031FA1752
MTGAISTVLPDSSGHGVASIYAELARDREWLQAGRTLTPDEYADMRRTLAGWTAHDRTFTDVRELSGPPSLLIGGTNPYYGKTLAYLTSHAAEPIVFFHFWKGSDPQAERTWPPCTTNLSCWPSAPEEERSRTPSCSRRKATGAIPPDIHWAAPRPSSGYGS